MNKEPFKGLTLISKTQVTIFEIDRKMIKNNVCFNKFCLQINESKLLILTKY